MARISYIEEKDHPELSAEIAKIRGGRGALDRRSIWRDALNRRWTRWRNPLNRRNTRRCALNRRRTGWRNPLYRRSIRRCTLSRRRTRWGNPLNRLRCRRHGVRNGCGRRLRLPDSGWRTRRKACRFGRCHTRILLALRQIFLRHPCAWLRPNHIGFGALWQRCRLYCSWRHAIDLRWLGKRRGIVARQCRLRLHSAIRNRLCNKRWRNSSR